MRRMRKLKGLAMIITAAMLFFGFLGWAFNGWDGVLIFVGMVLIVAGAMALAVKGIEMLVG